MIARRLTRICHAFSMADKPYLLHEMLLYHHFVIGKPLLTFFVKSN